MLPPGWITFFTPTLAAISMLSRNGKNASLASAQPVKSSPISLAFATAARAASTRLVIPMPIATNAPFFTYATQFDLVKAAIFQAIFRSFSSASFALFLLISLAFATSSSLTLSRSWNTNPPSIAL